MKYCQIFITLRCNKKCDFCFNRNIDKKNDISTTAFEIISKKIRNKGIHEIDILGGEPTLHGELFSIIKKSKEYFDTIYLSTNGTDTEIIEELSIYRTKLKIGISINNDGGCLQREQIEKLSDIIIRNGFLVKSLARKKNLIPEEAYPFIKKSIPFYLIYMDPVSTDDLDDCMPFHEFYSEFNRLKRIYNNINPVYCEGFLTQKKITWRCPAGSEKISIMPDGSVYPCYLFFRFPEFRLGNLLENNLDEILQNPVLGFFKRFKKNTCPELSCPIHNRCRGGCPAISYIFYRKLNGPDPRCLIK